VFIWADAAAQRWRNATRFIREVLTKNPGALLTATELDESLRAWRESRGLELRLDALIRFMNDRLKQPKGNREWPDLALCPAPEWRLTTLFERIGFCPPRWRKEPAPLTEYELNFVIRLARAELQSQDNPRAVFPMAPPFNNKAPGRDPGIEGRIIAHQRMERFIAKRSQMEGVGLGDMFCLDEVLISGNSHEGAIDEARAIGLMPSSFEPRALQENLESILSRFTNGSSKKLGDTLVLVEMLLFGQRPGDALDMVQAKGYESHRVATIHRWRNEWELEIRRPGNGEENRADQN